MMQPNSNDPQREELVTLIEAAGYSLFEQRRDWAECLLIRERERWFGRGVDATDALKAALGEALPSALGWQLLRAQAAPPVPTRTTPPIEQVVELEPAPPASTPKKAEPEQKTLFQRPPPPRHPSMSAAEALEGLEELRDKVGLQLPEVAAWSPERQRVYLLEAISGGRAIVDAVGSVPEVSKHMYSFSQYLIEISGRLWPGNISGLMSTCLPLDCSKDLEVKREYGPRTWLEVAQLAESKLDEIEVHDCDHERDEDGWLDPPEKLPPAPKALFNQVLSVVRDAAGPLDEKPRHARGGPRNTFAKIRKPELLAAARQLRWLRHAPVDPLLWGCAIGHLRFLAEACPEDFPELSEALAPDFRQPSSWSTLLGVDPDKRAKQLAWRKLLKSFPSRAARTGQPEGALSAWLLEALQAVASYGVPLARLSAALKQNQAPYIEAVLAISPESLGGERAERNRLRKLTALLTGNSAASEAEPQEIPTEPKPRPIQLEHKRMLDAILPHTRGKRALLITNRADPELEAVLKDTFEFGRLRLDESSLAKLSSYKQSISRGTFDLVILATGFQSHAMEHAIKPAARAAQIPYISAYRARRLDCMRAMMRDLALD